MEFSLTISLDNAEVEDLGVSEALDNYLREVAHKCAEGHTDAGIVRDGNGNTIGKWIIREEPEQAEPITRGEFVSRVVSTRRLKGKDNRSQAGNPRFEVTFANGCTYRTVTDAGMAYGIDNPTYRNEDHTWTVRRGQLAYVR